MKKDIICICISAVLLGISFFLSGIPCLAVCIAAYLAVGFEVLAEAIHNLLHGEVFDESFLMSIATLGAFAIGEYREAVAVMLFFQIGELFEHIAVHRSRRSISALMELRPDTVHRITETGTETTAPESVRIGDRIAVYPGERIPLDGTVCCGTSALDTSALTGESVPRTVRAGESVTSGCVNLTAVLEIIAEKEFAESTVSKILELVENAAAKKTKSESFIARFSKWYTPAVVGLAVLLAVLPPLMLHEPFTQWGYRALNFLVVSCPCALVISVPLSFFCGIGGASRHGILIKGSTYLEKLADVSAVAFDKTGTLTEGVFAVTTVHPVDKTEQTLLELAACAEQFSAHPIAAALRKACPNPCADVRDSTEISGKGVSAVVNGHTVLAGSEMLMQENGIVVCRPEESGTVVYVAADGVYCGSIVVADRLKEEAPKTVAALKSSGIRTVLLTGDRYENALSVQKTLDADAVFAELLPADKVEKLETLLPGSGNVVYIGDGVNDAPVLARADVGIAMGALGSDAAMEAADVVFMTDSLSGLDTVFRISRKTRRIVRENIVFALAVKLLILLLSAFGMTGLWFAVFADVGVCVLAILNALRALR